MRAAYNIYPVLDHEDSDVMQAGQSSKNMTCADNARCSCRRPFCNHFTMVIPNWVA